MGLRFFAVFHEAIIGFVGIRPCNSNSSVFTFDTAAMKKLRKQNNRNAYQVLEPRKMLAGDVTATVNDGLLQIIGDAEGNEIIVAGRPDGTATVFPVGDTTINGSTDPFVVSTTLEDVDVRLNEGDDNATIQGLVLSRSLRVRTGAGDDTTFVHHIEVQRFEQFAGDGNDQLEFNNVYSLGSIQISGENNDDIVSITNMASGTNTTLLTGNGADTVAIDNLGVKDNINLDTGGADDQVILTGLVYGYRANFNDSISMDASVTSPRNTTVDGGNGTDSIEQAGASLRDATFTSIENQQVDNLDALLDSVYAALTNADIDTTPFGRAVVVDPDDGVDGVDPVEPAITATAAVLIQNENDGAEPIDDGLILVGDNTTYTGATISLGDTFVSDQDVLGFDDNSIADAITGTFDATTGTLTFTGDGTAEEYQAALRAVTFNNTSPDPDETLRTVTTTVTLNDGADLTASRDINVVAIDQAPVIARTSSTVDVNLDDSPTLPVPIGTDELTVTDGDSAQLSRAIVAIDEGIEAGDVLSFTEVDGITGTFDAGVLTLTGDADVADYQTVLRSVTLDFAATVTAGQRLITFETTEAEGTDSQTSNVFELLVNVITDSTVLLQTSDNALPFFSEGGAPINADSGISIAAADGATVGEAQVSVTSGFVEGEDFLNFDGSLLRELNLADDINISGSYNSETGELTFTGDGSAETYQRLLRTVTYHSINQEIAESGTRVVQFSIISDAEFAVTRTATLTPRTEAQRTESIAVRDERLIQEYIEANGLTTLSTDSGLHYIVETEGNGQFPDENDDIVATYTGSYLNGVRFDSGTEIPFNLAGVIEGWTEGFQFFSPSGTGQLLIPSALAYGASGTSGGAGIPPNSVLRFDIEFVGLGPQELSVFEEPIT